LIHLNPNGRQQNKKHRPTVKLPEQLVEYVEQHQKQNPKGPIVAFDDKGVSSVRRTWRSTRKRSGLNGNVQTYSFRHTMARWLRKQSVPAWEVAAQLGHKSPTYSTTEIYAPYDPSHLENATKAIDRFLSELAHQLGATNISEYLSS
jgi:integrase